MRRTIAEAATPGKLVAVNGAEIQAFLKHARFRVLKPFLAFSANDTVEITARDYDPHNAAWIWTLKSGSRQDQLTELANDHLPILRAIDQHLAPI